MTITRITSLLALLLLVLTACQSPAGPIRKTAGYKADVAQTVPITISGDVITQGQRRIRREFTAESIREAGGGWRVRSLGGFSPIAFRLERQISGETKTWTIRFEEMNRSKWRDFRFEEGDHVFVHTAIF